MRKKFIAGNWKMNLDADRAEKLALSITLAVGTDERVEVAICPPFPYLQRVSQILLGSAVKLGAQNLYPKKEGAFTGEVSPAMLKDVGCQYVIVGHSERRHGMGETDAFINSKVKAGLEAGLQVILCVGETLQERESNQTEQVLDRQLTAGLDGIGAAQLSHMVLAYEPVWAIGTGKTATPEQAQQAHAFCRQRVGQICGAESAQNLQIQYGGSAKPSTAPAILAQPDVDGALVGAASLVADDFLAIIKLVTSDE